MVPAQLAGLFKLSGSRGYPLHSGKRKNITALWERSTSGASGARERVSAIQPGSGGLLQLPGADASPEAFERYAPGRRVLHVATHGFFLEGSCESALERQFNVKDRDERLPAIAENPVAAIGTGIRGG